MADLSSLLVSYIEPVASVVYVVVTFEYDKRWSLSLIPTIVRYDVRII